MTVTVMVVVPTSVSVVMTAVVTDLVVRAPDALAVGLVVHGRDLRRATRDGTRDRAARRRGPLCSRLVEPSRVGRTITRSTRMAGIAVFDINETTLDLGPVRVIIDELVPDEGGSRAWFARLLQLSMTVTATGGYTEFGVLARHALEAVAATGGRRRAGAIDDAAWARVAEAMATLPAHPDVAPALDRLRGGGWRLVALTNSAPASVTAQLERAGLAPRFEHILSVDTVERFKPAPEPYRHAASVLGVEPDQLWMVASHDWDLAGARAVGLATAFVDRPGQSWAPALAPPDLTVDDFGQLADRLLG